MDVVVTTPETQLVSNDALEGGPQVLHFVVPEERREKVFVKGGKLEAKERISSRETFFLRMR